jgi:hypothetical protein
LACRFSKQLRLHLLEELDLLQLPDLSVVRFMLRQNLGMVRELSTMLKLHQCLRVFMVSPLRRHKRNFGALEQKNKQLNKKLLDKEAHIIIKHHLPSLNLYKI